MAEKNCYTTAMDESKLRQRQLLITWLTVPILVILVVTMPALFTWFVLPDVITGDAPPQVWQIIAFIFILIVPATVFTMVVMRISHGFAKQTFDPIFTPLGLKGSSYLNNGRQYHGIVQNRQVDIYLHPVMRQRSFVTLPGAQIQAMTYFGHVIQIYVEAKSTGKFGLSLLGSKLPSGNTAIDVPSALINNIQDIIFKRGLSFAVQVVTAANQVASFHPEQTALQNLTVTTPDRPWAERLLADEKVVEPLKRLALLAPQSAMFTVQALPASVKIAMHLHKQLLTKQTTSSWLQDLVLFADAVESGPQSSVTFTETRMEHIARTNPGYFTKYAILGVVGFFLCITLGMALLFLTLAYFGQL